MFGTDYQTIAKVDALHAMFLTTCDKFGAVSKTCELTGCTHMEVNSMCSGWEKLKYFGFDQTYDVMFYIILMDYSDGLVTVRPVDTMLIVHDEDGFDFRP